MITLWTSCLYLLSLTFSGVSSARIGFGALGCWRDHSNTKTSYNEGLSAINRFLSSQDIRPPGSLLRVIYEIIWPRREVPENLMYCFDEEYHGNIPTDIRRSYASVMEDFRTSVNNTLNITRMYPRSNEAHEAFHNLHMSISLQATTFFQVHDIEKSSMFLREYAMLLLGSLTEYINSARQRADQREQRSWQTTLENACYVLAKFSYWFIRFMPKKQADYIIFDRHKFAENHLGFVNQATGKRVTQFEEALAGCGVGDSNSCNDYTLGMLKAARISARLRIEEYWKDILSGFRRLFKEYCTATACKNDRYEEFYITVGEPVGLQFLAATGENGYFCTSDLCSTMWLSTGGYKDYGYYRQCMGKNHFSFTPSECLDEQWKLCSAKGSCSQSKLLRNKQFPVALRSVSNSKCMDCSATSTWCKQGTCPNYVHPGTAPSPSSICLAPESCRGAQFQIHNFRAQFNEPIEILDDVHFSYGAPQDGHLDMLSGDIFSGAFVKTQYYTRLEHKYSVTSKRTGETRGPFYCPLGKSWSMMRVEEQAVCAQSAYTIYKKLDPEKVVSPEAPESASARLLGDGTENFELTAEIQEIVQLPKQSLDLENWG